MDRVDEAIQEIAKKHGVAVGKDDPIMILLTLHSMLLEDSKNAQQALLERFRQELEVIQHSWGKESKDLAQKALNSSLEASKQAMQQNAAESKTKLEGAIIECFRQEAENLTKIASKAQRSSTITLIASTITVIAAITTLIATQI